MFQPFWARSSCSELKEFPEARYGNQTLAFHPAPFQAPAVAYAALVFAWQEDRVLVCNIKGRGWCIPSGRLEPGESSLDAATREALEEGGATLEGIEYFGTYEITEGNQTRWADCFTAQITALQPPTHPQESTATKLLTLPELADLYYLWNPLTEAVFAESKAAIQMRTGNKTPP